MLSIKKIKMRKINNKQFENKINTNFFPKYIIQREVLIIMGSI